MQSRPRHLAPGECRHGALREPPLEWGAPHEVGAWGKSFPQPNTGRLSNISVLENAANRVRFDYEAASIRQERMLQSNAGLMKFADGRSWQGVNESIAGSRSALQDWDCRVRGNSDQPRFGLNADALAKDGGEFAGWLFHGYDGGAFGDADNRTGLSFVGNEIVRAQTVRPSQA